MKNLPIGHFGMQKRFAGGFWCKKLFKNVNSFLASYFGLADLGEFWVWLGARRNVETFPSSRGEQDALLRRFFGLLPKIPHS